MSSITKDSLDPKMEEADAGDDLSTALRMTPAVRRICCCSVTAAAGFVAAYTLVSYAIALIYEVVWVVEAEAGLPVASALLMICYSAVIAATVTLVHGLITKENKYLMSWLICVVAVLIPECALVFYMSINHWGLQGVYGGAELACYVARLPGIVCGVVLVQSAYALRELRKKQLQKGDGGASAVTSEFDASHYVPDPAHAHAFTNDAFLQDNGKPAGSVADLRRHFSLQQLNYGYPMLPQPPPAYWQHLAERHYAASLHGYPKPYGPYGTWVGPRNPYDYKRRHSIVGTFHDEYDGKQDYDDRIDSKSEMGYPYRGADTKSEMGYPYRRTDTASETGYPRSGFDTKSETGYPRGYYDRPDRFPYHPEYDPRFFPREKNLDDRYEQYPGTMRPQEAYGGSLMRYDPYGYSRDRHVYAGEDLRNSHNSVGRESDDMTKYKDVAL